MSLTKRLFVTGCNRGIGQKFVELVYQRNPEIEMHITSRQDPSQFSLEWQKIIPNHRLKCYKLDVTDQASISRNSTSLFRSQTYFDFIVANAGRGFDIGTEIPSPELAQAYLKTNLEGTINFIKHFLPVLADNGRLIIVSSRYATFANQTPYMIELLRNQKITEQDIIGLSKEYIKAAKNRDMGKFSWTAYGTSKALLNAWARFVLPKYMKPAQSYVVMHPGWCQTKMGGDQAPSSAFEGAQRIYDCLWLQDIEPDKFYNQRFCSYETCQ